MARIPEIVRRNSLSQVAAGSQVPNGGGMGWGALADIAQAGAAFIKPLGEKRAKEAGLNAVYRDADGTLKVKERSVLGGEMADLQNSAAYAKFLGQRKIDMSQSFTEMANNYEFDPAGFKAASDGYIKIIQEDADIPALLKEELLQDAQEQATQRFNGLFNAETDRNYREADRNTNAARDMLADDYVSLVIGGDTEAAAAKMKEIEEVSRFREGAAYISETPAETQAYLRGVRGAGKVAALTQSISGLNGISQVPDALRTEIETMLKDPDLTPQDRNRFMGVYQGALKSVTAGGIVGGLTNDGYGAKVARAESGGSATAKNPLSSATGLHQFISGTWMENVRELQAQGGAAWAQGLSNDEILEYRNVPGASTEVFDYFTAKNQRALSAAGLPVNDATSYMAHFFGVGGAIKVLSASPSALISDLLPEMISANPFMANYTVADAQNWAARKMTMKASDISAQNVALNDIEDGELRAMASEMMTERFNTRRRIETAAAAEYDLRLQSKDATLTTQEVMSNQSLSDAMQTTLVKKITDMNADKIAVQETLMGLSDPKKVWSPFDADERKSVDAAYQAVLGDVPPASPEGRAAAAEITARTGFMPRTAFNALRGGITSTDPAQLAQSMEFAGQILRANPGAIDMYDGAGDVQRSLSDYTFYSGLMDADAAAARMIEANTPEARGRLRNLSDQAKEAAETLKPDDVIAHLSQAGFPSELGNDVQQGEMMAEYTRLFTDEFLRIGDNTLARNRALDSMTRVYGPETVTGSTRVMKFPPQNFYPTPPGAPDDWMRVQLEADVSGFAYGSDAKDTFAFTPLAKMLTGEKWVDANRITILSDEATRRDIAGGKPPSYQVMYTDDDGALQMINQRYRFAPPAAVFPINESAFNAGRDEQTAGKNLRAWRETLRAQYGDAEAMRMLMADKPRYSASPPPQE